MILMSFGDDLLHGESAPPALAAKKLKVNYIDNTFDNITNNTAIFKRVVKSVCDIENPEDFVLLIGWTTSDHIELGDNGKPFTYSKNKVKYSNPMYNKLVKFEKYLFEPVLINERRVSYVLGLQELLHSLGIRYYMFNTHDKIEYNDYTEQSVKYINGKYYCDAISSSSTMLGHLKKQNIKYPSEYANQAWADFICKKLTVLGLVE